MVNKLSPIIRNNEEFLFDVYAINIIFYVCFSAIGEEDRFLNEWQYLSTNKSKIALFYISLV